MRVPSSQRPPPSPFQSGALHPAAYQLPPPAAAAASGSEPPSQQQGEGSAAAAAEQGPNGQQQQEQQHVRPVRAGVKAIKSAMKMRLDRMSAVKAPDASPSPAQPPTRGLTWADKQGQVGASGVRGRVESSGASLLYLRSSASNNCLSSSLHRCSQLPDGWMVAAPQMIDVVHEYQPSEQESDGAFSRKASGGGGGGCGCSIQ